MAAFPGSAAASAGHAADAHRATTLAAQRTQVVRSAMMRNGSFEAGANGWKNVVPGTQAGIAGRAGVAHTHAAVLQVRRHRAAAISDNPDTAGVRRGDAYSANAWVRASRKNQRVRLVVTHFVSGHPNRVETRNVRLGNRRWHKVATALATRATGGVVDVRVQALPGRRGLLFVDNVQLVRTRRVATSGTGLGGGLGGGLPLPSDPGSAGDVLPYWGAPAWQDNFNGNAIDPHKWNVRTRSNLGLTIDSAIPSADMVDVSGGLLHLRGQWLPKTETRSKSATGVDVLTHKTGYIDQRPMHQGDVSMAHRWGRWEIRAKTASGPDTMGALSAFWLRNSNKGEIDIMEAWGYGKDFPSAGKALKDTAKTTVFTDTTTTSSLAVQVRHKEHGATARPWAGFHTYAWELLPNRAAMVVDGKTIWTATPATLPALWGPSFQSPLHMRVNLHIGPSEKYWGIPDPAHRDLTRNLDYQVDYVRYYAPPGGGN